MTPTEATCWTLIGAAAQGDGAARADFARRYQPLARTYFQVRWGRSPLRDQVEDALQEVFVECFKPQGVLLRASQTPPEGFRPFFQGVLRNIARRFEERHRPHAPLPDESRMAESQMEEASLGAAMDQAWARSLMREAAREQTERARQEEAQGNPRPARRVELLQLRFQEGLPIREIAQSWQVEAAWLHYEYAAARNEFREALRRVLAFHLPGASREQLDSSARELLQLLG
mgnify:CR=1 FL=1